jgi:hypothetical protein
MNTKMDQATSTTSKNKPLPLAADPASASASLASRIRSWMTVTKNGEPSDNAMNETSRTDETFTLPTMSPSDSLQVLLLEQSDHNNPLSESSSESSWSDDDYLDLKFSMASNLFFLAGACCQTFISLWDWKSAVDEANGLVDDDDDDGVYVYTFSDKAYYVLYTLGPLLYLCNSIVDIRWAMAFLSFPSLSCCCFNRNQATIAPTENFEDFHPLLANEDHSTHGNAAISASISATSMSTSTSVEMEERWWGLVVAIVFGLGALCEIYSTVLDDVYEDADDYDDDHYLIKIEKRRKWFVSNYKMTTIAMHLYLLCGIIQLISQRKSHRGSHFAVCCGGAKRRQQQDGTDDDHDRQTTRLSFVDSFAIWIMMIGTLLFIIGTLMDCVISYIYDPQVLHEIDRNKAINVNDVVLAICDVTSSIFWNVDAILYIVADVLVYRLYDRTGSTWNWFFPCTSGGNDVNDIPLNETVPLLQVVATKGLAEPSYSTLSR